MRDATIRRPDERSCERCERREVWNGDDDTWRVEHADGEPLTGNLYCIHEWDINGSFVPIEGASDSDHARV